MPIVAGLIAGALATTARAQETGTVRGAPDHGAVVRVVGPAVAQVTQVQPPSQELAAEVQQVREELTQLRAEFDRLRQAYDERFAALERRLVQLGGGPSVVPPPDPTVPDELDVPVAREPRAPPPSSQVFNPDTSVIGNFVTTAGQNPFSDEPSLSLEEVEVAFQAIVDPYSRADFYIAAGPEGVEVEEGFLTLTALPARMLLKVGKLRAQFGKMNTLHTHRVPGVDRPLVSNNLLGGREGLSDAGLSLSHLVLNPVLFLELTGEVFAGHSSVFQSSARSKLNYLGRVRAYRDLTEATNIDLGASFAFGPTNLVDGYDRAREEAEDRGELEALGLDKQLFGIDATLRYRPLRGALYRRLNLSTELVWSRQELPAGGETTAFGFYGLGEYQFARRWYVGGRVDRSARPFDGAAVDTGGAVFLTFWPTEFSLVRGQYRRINFHENRSANEFLVQFNFSIGAHGAHIF